MDTKRYACTSGAFSYRALLVLITLLVLLVAGLQLLYPGGLRGLLRDFII